jgi:hypothetical protein
VSGDERIVRVLEEHRRVYDDYSYLCACGQWRDKRDDGTAHRAHVAAALLAAGFGHVAQAKAEALRDAADEVQDECLASSTACFCGSADWLRDRADRIAGGEQR